MKKTTAQKQLILIIVEMPAWPLSRMAGFFGNSTLIALMRFGSF
jgi:hypothetical protein